MTEKENKLFEQAVEYFNKKDYDKSKVLYEEILKINSKSSNVYGNLGVIYKIKGDINTAVKCYVEAIKLNPKNLLIYNNLGNLYCFEKGQYELGVKHYKKAIFHSQNISNQYLHFTYQLKSCMGIFR